MPTCPNCRLVIHHPHDTLLSCVEALRYVVDEMIRMQPDACNMAMSDNQIWGAGSEDAPVTLE